VEARQVAASGTPSWHLNSCSYFTGCRAFAMLAMEARQAVCDVHGHTDTNRAYNLTQTHANLSFH
jgi:hypothetical protein